MGFLDKYQDETYALLRIITGFLFLWHGTVKLLNYPVAFSYDMSPLMMTAGVIELVAGAAVMIGLFTRPMAFLSSGTMAAAYWMAHGNKGFWPITNGGELAIMFCFAFLYIAAKGSGKWAVGK